jgi:hypothetical protein
MASAAGMTLPFSADQSQDVSAGLRPASRAKRDIVDWLDVTRKSVIVKEMDQMNIRRVFIGGCYERRTVVDEDGCGLTGA